ncbi:hypothetical protein PRIPAC_70232 [Pristionchus pacificus]|uniref:Uncharacterized protein n=1 Tax=Pristionchus pacificus TaxID=54126 RepID=A0A2A6CT97_PRIPA|nr:hypothetical protein PRIPAC_70232 [Pristionchus pacificus]|eukprot:PDM81328.1 hypothetical protein PRIPAC_36331 [Pristionchus pacificus]
MSSAISRALSIVGARIGKETKFDDNMSILLHAVSATTENQAPMLGPAHRGVVPASARPESSSFILHAMK